MDYQKAIEILQQFNSRYAYDICNLIEGQQQDNATLRQRAERVATERDEAKQKYCEIQKKRATMFLDTVEMVEQERDDLRRQVEFWKDKCQDKNRVNTKMLSDKIQAEHQVAAYRYELENVTGVIAEIAANGEEIGMEQYAKEQIAHIEAVLSSTPAPDPVREAAKDVIREGEFCLRQSFNDGVEYPQLRKAIDNLNRVLGGSNSE